MNIYVNILAHFQLTATDYNVIIICYTQQLNSCDLLVNLIFSPFFYTVYSGQCPVERLDEAIGLRMVGCCVSLLDSHKPEPIS